MPNVNHQKFHELNRLIREFSQNSNLLTHHDLQQFRYLFLLLCIPVLGLFPVNSPTFLIMSYPLTSPSEIIFSIHRLSNPFAIISTNISIQICRYRYDINVAKNVEVNYLPVYNQETLISLWRK